MGESDTIEFHASPLTEAQVIALRTATRTEHAALFPPTFATIFRRSEFQWLERMQVDMRELLHTGQEYEFRRPLRIGDAPVACTRVGEVRERAGMRFVTLVTEIACAGEIAVVAHSTFVLRSQAAKGKA